MVALMLLSITAIMLYPKFFIVPIARSLLEGSSSSLSQLQTLALMFALAEGLRYWQGRGCETTLLISFLLVCVSSLPTEASVTDCAYQRAR